MHDEIEPHQKKTPLLIYVICISGFLSSLLPILLSFTEVAYMVGRWYVDILPISSIIIWTSLAGIWKMKKWGVIIYTITIIVTQTILIKYNVMWSYTSIIIPVIVTLTIWFYFKRMT
jgi:hypothetical protein